MRSGTRKIGLRLRDEALLNTSSGNFLQSERTSTMHQKERRTRKSQLRELTGFRLLFGDPRRYHREPRFRSSCPAPTKIPEEQLDPCSWRPSAAPPCAILCSSFLSHG